MAPRKKAATEKQTVAEKPADTVDVTVQHAAVQVSRPDGDTYYIDEAARDRHEG